MCTLISVVKCTLQRIQRRSIIFQGRGGGGPTFSRGGGPKHPPPQRSESNNIGDWLMQSKKDGKDQESIQSSATSDPGYQWESNKL